MTKHIDVACESLTTCYVVSVEISGGNFLQKELKLSAKSVMLKIRVSKS
jgi:hypothetical protein